MICTVSHITKSTTSYPTDWRPTLAAPNLLTSLSSKQSLATGFKENSSVRNLISPIPAVRVAEIRGTRSFGRPNFVRCSLTCAESSIWNCLMPMFRCLKFWSGFRIFGKSVHRWKTYVPASTLHNSNTQIPGDRWLSSMCWFLETSAISSSLVYNYYIHHILLKISIYEDIITHKDCLIDNLM